MPKLDTAKVDAFLKEKYGASTNKAGIDTAKVDAFIKEKYAAPDKEVVQQLKTSNSLRNMALGMQADNLHDQIGSIVRSNPIHAYNHLTTDAASEAMDVEEAVERYSYNPIKEVETEMPESVVVADKVEMRGDILRNKIKAEYGATDASEGYGVRAGKTATSLVEQLPKAEDGRYIIDGYEYTHPEAVSVMQQVVENTMHPDLWKTDASYRDHYSWLNHGKSYKSILDEQYASLSSKLDALQSKIEDRIKKQVAGIGVFSKDPHMALIGISEGEGMNKLRKVNDLLTSIKKDNFWGGLDEGFDSIDAVTLGISSFLSEVQMTKVLDKVYNGEPLTERDQIYYDLWEVEQELKDIRSVKGQSWWNTVGSSVGTSAEMAPSFFVGMGSVGNIFKMSSLPLKAGMQFVKNSAKKGAWEGIKKGVGATMKVAGRSLGNVAKAEAMGMIAAPFLPSTWSEVASKRGDQYSLENGKLVYKPKAMWKDIANAWIEQGNELASEFIGTRIGDILGAGASTFGRMLGLDRVANKIGISSQATKLLGYEKPQWLKVLQRNLGYTGPVAEPLSEVWGDVASNLMKEGLTGDGEFSQFKSKDYWTTTLAVSTIYGGSIAMATAPLAIYDYKNSPLQGMRKQRDGYLGMIKDKVLRNNLLSISSMGDLEQMSSALAHLDWGNMNKVDIAYGMDFIRADMAYKVMIGDAKESVRQEQYQNVVNDAYAVAYKGATGNTPTGYIVRVEAEDGSLYYVLRGSLDSASEDLLTCLNEEGNVVPLHPSKIKARSTASLEDFMADGYTQLFATQVEMERQRDIIRDYKALENPTAEDIARIMSAFGATQQNAGDTVTLVDGGTGVVQEFDAETGKYLVNVVSNDGNTVMLDVPFYDILSNDAQMASAQSSRFAEQTLDDMDISLAQEESAEEMQEAEAVGDLKVGDIITTPNGTQGRVMGFNEGNVVVDENVENTTGSVRDAYIEEYSLNDIIKDAPSTEATTEVIAPQEAMEAPQPVEDIKIVPVQEDGSVDYDAITDASQFAELYTKEIGSREEATNEVIAMRDALTAQIAENAKKTQKATTPNERVKMRKAANALAERVAFYNKVLEMLAPQEVAETPVEPIVEDAAAVEVDTPREVGIIENEYSERLLDAEKKVYNAMAEALGLTVEFVKEVVETDGTRANAKIDGNKVIVGWRERDRAISFLIGHEFLHRMRDLAPETYEMFKDSVQTYKGEERWNKDLARMQARYRAQNVPISKELLEEEVIADFTGELVEKKDVFSSYIEANKENKTLLDKIAEVFRAIRDFLRSKGVEDRKLEDVVSALNNLIAEATAEATGNSQREGVEMAISQPKFSLASLVGVHNLSLDKLRKAIKMGGLANPSVAVIDVDKQTHDDYGEYSLVLPKNMVDARQGKNAGTWAGDAWTPTYPQIIKRIKDEKYYSRFHTDIEALPEAMRNKVRLEFDSFMEGRSADPLAYWYLFEKGSTPELVLVPSRYSDDITNAVSEATKGSFSMYGLSPDERAKCVDAYIVAKFNGDRAAFEQEMQERINRLTEALETKKSDRVKKWAQDTIDAIKEYGFDYDAVADFIRDVGYDAREKGTVNDSATTMAAREQIKANNLEADYEAWLNSLEERYGIDEYIFDGYTNSGNRRYLPHTLENVSKWMKKQGRQGAVATFPSFGVFIATAIPKMTSLESIRKRKALLGKSKEEYDAFREKWENVYFELGKRFQPDAKGFDDYGYWRLIEAVGKSNPKEFIKKEYGIEMSEEDMAMFNDMVNAIRTEYPARYFETKFERPLQLSDFTAAVVPNDIPLDVESRLKDAGVEVIEYEKGDNASRAEAMQKASQMENVRFSLMDDAQAAAEVAPYLEPYNNDLVTFNALVNKVKDVAEKYPNATWPERFIKENYEDENEEDFINRLKWTISNYAVEEEEKVYSAEKQTIEETFGGIWIEDRAEFAKFAKAVNNTPFEENGEGIAYTDNYFYAYYRSIDGQPIPFASVYMNKEDSQDIVNTILKAKRNGEKTGIRRYFDRAYERARHISGKNDGDLGTNKELSNPRRNDRMDSELSRYGAYYDSPELFVKSTRAYKGSRIKYSLQAPTFYSNAEYAVRTIKQEKATPEQWLKMIEKNGGLKAGEDKWLGLSDWLKASDKKTLTKDEVLQYIAENDIQIEEVSYGDVADISKEEIYESAEFAELREGLTEYDEDDNPYINRERYDELRSESYDFVDGFSLDYWGEELEVNSPAAAATYLGLTKADREINSTRLDYTTKGLANKREIALVVPAIEPYNQSDEIHFGDAGEGRAVAWIRFGETTDADGKRILVIDEIQSKRHQDGRENGYKDETAYRREKAKLDELEAELFERRQQLIKKLEEKYGSYDNYLKGETRGWRTGLYPNDEVMTPEEIAEYNATDLESNVNTKLKELKEKYLEGVPSAPFEKNWAELAFKRMLRYAAENGYDYVAWTTGDQQAERYNIGNVIERVVSYPVDDNMEIWIHRRANERIHLVADNNGVILNSNSSLADAGTNVSEVLGKDLSQRIYGREGEDATIYAGRGKEYAAKEIAVDGLRIGGEGMRGFYDQMLPSFVKKYTKKWGAEVKDITMPELEENNTMHAVNVTDSMRESVMQGQPKFSLRTGFYGRVDYITDIAYEYGITQPIFVAETTEEYVKMFKDMGVKNPEKFRTTNGAYKKTNDTIYLDAEKLSRRSEIFRTLLHERTHAITSRLNNQLVNIVSKINKDDILAYRDELLSDVYKNIAPDSVIDEIISYIAGKITRDYARRLFSGELSIEDIITNIAPIIENTGDKRFDDIHHAILPLLKENLLIQKELYNGQKENPIVIPRESVGGDEKRDAQSTDDNDISRDGGRNHSHRGAYRGAKGEVTPRFALRDGGITLGDNKDIESIDVGDEGVGSTTEEQVRTYLKHKHYTEVDNIRKKYKRLRDIARIDYKERMKVRMDRIGTLRTNSAKIEYILGENDELALPLEHQALVRIARGEIRIKWENSEDGRKRGLAAEVGLKDGEKRLYASLTKDATLYFDEAVHQWWQMIGGYEREVDTQDLRNALIEALSEAHSPSMAITLLRNIYNAEEVVYDETMALYEHEEAKEIAEEQSRYDEDIAEFEANKDAMIREYEERASFFDAISAMEGTILDLRKRIDQIKEKASRRVSNIQAQYREMRELIARTKAAVKEVITSDNIRSFQSSELRRLINKVDKARSIYEVDNILVEVQSIMLDVSIRTQRMDMDRMLKLRLPNGEAVEAWVDQQMAEGKLSAKEGHEILDNMWKGKNASGVSVAKRIDGTTANTMAILRALISPTAHSKMVEDVEAPQRGAMVRVDGELSLSQSNIEQNEARLQELEEKKATATAEGTEAYTSADAEEYAARTIYDSYLRAVMHKQDIQTILEAIQDVREMYYGNPEKEAVRDHHIESLRDEMVEVKKKYLEALQALNEEMLSLMREGRDALRTFRMAEQAHKEAIVKLGLDALGVKTRIVENTTRTMPRVTAFLRSTLNAPYYTFQTTLKEIDHLAPNGEGEFYNHFMFGMQQCSDNFYIQHTAHIAEVAQKMRVLLGKKGKKDATLIADVIEESDSKIIATITYGKGVNRGEIINPESYDLTISNAMYLIAMWRQPMYRNSMMVHGITQEAIDTIYDAVDTENKGYIPFMNWVNDTFLPDTRLLYDKVHKAMFGVSMAKERNYFPARVIGYEEKQDISLNEVGMLPSTITGAIVQRVRNMRMPDFRMNYFKILMGHLQDMDQWSSYAPMIRDLNTLCSNTLFREKCNKVMPGVNADGGGQGSLFQSFKTTAAIAVNCYRPKKAIADDIIMTVLRGWAGSNIAFRGWTAIKQLTSSPVFALYMLDGKCQELYLRNMGYGLTHMRKLHEWALENSPSYKQRWESKFAGMDVFTKKVGEENGFGVHHKWRATKAGKYAITFDNAMRKFAVDLGLTPNAAVDAFTVMTGIKTIYDYELQKEMERDGVNTPTEGMKKLAMLKAEIAFNSTQQSGENVYLSQLQKERTFATSVLTVYLNSSFGFHRLRVTGAQELWKQMTDAEYKKSIYEKYGDKAEEVLKDARKKAASQILQGVVGDLLFAVMSGGGTIGTFTMFGDGDDEGEIWEQTKKSLGVGVVNILTGGYMGGSILASALQGYKVSMSTPFDELVNDIRWYASNDSLLSAFGHTMNIISKYRYGLDFETLANTVAGVQGLIEGSGGNEAVMNILNVPQSQIAIIAGRRRPEETSSEYVTRIMRMESIIQAEDGSKRERELQKQYEMAYRKNVVVRTSGATVWQEMVTLEDDYKDITKELGWTANANPNEKVWETGMYVAPAEGISEAEYLALAQLEAEIAALEGYITHFEGTEDNYYNLVQRVTGVKKQFIEQYEQFK